MKFPDADGQRSKNSHSCLIPRLKCDVVCSIKIGLHQGAQFQKCQTYDSYGYIEKNLRSLSRKWRPQVMAPRTLKNLNSMPLKELICTLKVHEQEL